MGGWGLTGIRSFEAVLFSTMLGRRKNIREKKKNTKYKKNKPRFLKKKNNFKQYFFTHVCKRCPP